MKIHDVRRRNFRRLLAQLGGDRKAMLSIIGGDHVNFISRLLSESPNPKSRKTIGHQLARKLEEAFHKPEGWMDALNVSEQAMTVAEHFDVISGEDRAAIEHIIAMAMRNRPPSDPPTPLLPPPAPTDVSASRRRRA